jgi:hypothetical protein
MSDLLKRTIAVSTSVEKLHHLLDGFSKERSMDTKDPNLYPTLTMVPLLNTSRRGLKNTLHHATRTNFLSVEFSLTTSFVH